MEKVLLVAVGGAAGAVARYGLGVQALRLWGPGWPFGTFIANVSGGLLMGVLAGYLAHRGGGVPVARLSASAHRNRRDRIAARGLENADPAQAALRTHRPSASRRSSGVGRPSPVSGERATVHDGGIEVVRS